MHKNYSYKIIEQSEQNILTLEDIKNYTRISVNNDDDLLNSIAKAAIQIAENFIKISLLRKVIEVKADNAMNVRLPFVPVVDIIKVDADGDEIDLNNITVNGEIVTLTQYVECKQLKITYVAGYNDPSLVPAPIVQGIMQHISSMYDARGVGVGSLDGVLDLYRPYRRMTLGAS